MKGSMRIVALAPSQDLLHRLFHRVCPEAEMVQRFKDDPARAVFVVPANRMKWFVGHCEDLGIGFTDDDGTTAESADPV